jgi:TPR repeat protein
MGSAKPPYNQESSRASTGGASEDEMRLSGVAALGLAWLAAAAFLAPPAAAAAGERRVALVIGNAGYKNLPRLANPKPDAEGVAAALKQAGFELIGNEAEIDLGKRDLEAAIRAFSYALRGGAVALFYYSGHGIEIGGHNYLVPVDGNPQTTSDADFELVDLDLVLKQLRLADNRLSMVVLDACRSNPFGAQGLRSAGSGLAEIKDRPSGTVISYATAPGTIARDGPAGSHSPYSAARIEAIQQPGLGVLDMFNRVAVTVETATKGEQQPWVSSTAIRGQFYFVDPQGGTAGAASVAPDAEIVFWQSIAGSSNPADYKAYLQQYPSGRFASLARLRAEPAKAQAAAKPTTAPLQQQALATPGPQPRITAEEANRLGNLALKDQRFADAAIWFRQAAEQGLAPAQAALAQLYRTGRGVPQDFGQARLWFAKAAEQGFAPAQAGLGGLYLEGNGGARDPAQGLALIRKSAEQGLAQAQNALGMIYREGKGVARDPVQARLWFQKAAAQGLAGGELNLGLAYENGLGGAKDYAQALAWYRKAAEQDNARAEMRIAQMYQKGWGVPKDGNQALVWVRRAAEHGDGNAQRLLAARTR